MALALRKEAARSMALAKVPVERASVSLVSCHIAVYPLMADRAIDVLANLADLLMAPVCHQRHMHKVDGTRGGRQRFDSSAAERWPTGEPVMVDSPVIPITAKLMTDGRWVNAELFGNVRLRQTMLTEAGNLVS